MSEPSTPEELVPSSPSTPGEGRFKKLFSKLTSFRGTERVKKQTEQEIKEALMSDIVKRTINDIGSHGYTIRSRSDNQQGWITERAHGLVHYMHGGRQYTARLSAIYDTSNNSLTRTLIEIVLRDVPTDTNKEQRTGQIETIRHPSKDEGTERVGFYETGNKGFFYDVTRKDNNGDLSLVESNAFLRELLDAQIDAGATQTAFEKDQQRVGRNEIIDVFWNKDRPGELTSFFNDVNSAQHPNPTLASLANPDSI